MTMLDWLSCWMLTVVVVVVVEYSVVLDHCYNILVRRNN